MKNGDSGRQKGTDLLVTAKTFFRELVTAALESRKMSPRPIVANYLVELLEFYVDTDNLYDFCETTGKRRQDTLAEMFLSAQLLSGTQRLGRMKRLADMSLYVSGFFGDSLSRKVVDIDYYAEIGGTAYSHLAVETPEDTLARVYSEFSDRFMDYVDILTYISQKSMIQSNEDLLRLYDRYVFTGSELARDQLLEKGLLPGFNSKKSSKQ